MMMRFPLKHHQIRQPKDQPDAAEYWLVNVTVQEEPRAGVGDDVHGLESREPGGGGAVALRQGRQAAAAAVFGLHYSQCSLKCLDPKEMLIDVGSKNFFLCLDPAPASETTSAAPAKYREDLISVAFHELLATVRMIDDLPSMYSHHRSASARCSQYTQKPFDELTSTQHDRTMNIIPVSLPNREELRAHIARIAQLSRW